MGRGYSFEALRAKVLFNEKLHKKHKPRFNSNAFGHAMSNYGLGYFDLVTDHDITGNYGVDISTLLAKLEEGYL